MSAKIISKNDEEVTIQVKVKFSNSMLESEENILSAVNEAGNLATEEALHRFDTDGTDIIVGGIKLTSKGKVPKIYETPYGSMKLERHVYQNSKGGKTYCPLDYNARIVVSSTPRFAKIISHKYSDLGSSRIKVDLQENHGRPVVRSFVQNVADAVASVALAKEEDWSYALPDMDESIKSITIGLDGTCLLYCEEGWREAMVGTIGFYNGKGERLHTIYTGASPEYGKEKFFRKFTREIEQVKRDYPSVNYIGLADGAKDNWPFLKRYCEHLIIDFYHATEYLSKASDSAFTKNKSGKIIWLNNSCHKLKHKMGAASRLLHEMETWQEIKMSVPAKEQLQKSITYYRNNKKLMKYSDFVNHNFPIGSGVTEAACKVIVKQRLCNSGMKWKERGASAVISLRTLSYTKERWQQFWNKIDQYGFQAAA